MLKKVYPIIPCPKPRMTKSDKWKKRPEVLRYWAFCDLCRLFKVNLPKSDSEITFIIPVTKSWTQSKKLQMIGKPHESKPDLSNLLKAIEDAVMDDDSGIWHYSGLKKIWGEEGKIEIIEP